MWTTTSLFHMLYMFTPTTSSLYQRDQKDYNTLIALNRFLIQFLSMEVQHAFMASRHYRAFT